MINTIVWFRRDLRITDNPALTEAIARGSVIAVYIHAPEEEAPWPPGAASNWWLHHSLSALQRQLTELNIPLVVAHQGSQTCLLKLAKKTHAQAVYWNRLYEPACQNRDQAVEAALADAGIETQHFNSQLLFEPKQVRNKQGSPFKVFTPFWRHYQSLISQQHIHVRSAPITQPRPAIQISERSKEIDKLGLLSNNKQTAGFYQYWQPGEAGAFSTLKTFIEDQLSSYKRDRDYPALNSTSRLSPHLHFGEIGPKQIWAAIVNLPNTKNRLEQESRNHFLSELAWREFAHHLLAHFPHTTEHPLNPRYQQFPWWHSDRPDQLTRHNSANEAAELLHKWQHGKTGISMIDAAMRELRQSGTMHNRCRMLVASLLTKNMGIHWHEGAKWFWDNLVDANLANNSLGWQWAAGSGADASPYFRIFNPDTQAQRFDESQAYRHRWLNTGWQHRSPCIDLKASRADALECYQNTRHRAA